MLRPYSYARCHMVNGVGGVLGPDLSRLGAARPAAYLIDSIRDPDKDLSDGMSDPNNHFGVPLDYDTVRVVPADGRQVIGVAKNEDAFSIQLLGVDGQLHLLLKKDLKSVIHEHKSLMPAYGPQALNNADLNDLVAYFQSLRGGAFVKTQAQPAEGLTYERILDATHEPQNWHTYSGSYTGWRHSSLEQLNTENVADLRLKWAFQTAALGQFETTPLVVDGVLYGTPDRTIAPLPSMRTPAARFGATSEICRQKFYLVAAW